MIFVCPNCGNQLDHSVNNGLTICTKCSYLVHNNIYNKLLSAGWILRKERFNIDRLKSEMKLDEDETILIQAFVGDNLYGHEELRRVLKKFNIDSI